MQQLGLPYDGPQPLADKLYDIYNITIHASTIYRILKREKIRYTHEYKRWVKEKPKLYCLDTPGRELQMDACYPFGRQRKLASNDPYCPQQNGKIERYHRTMKKEFFHRYISFHDPIETIEYKYQQWLHYYNTHRRHGGYGMNRMMPAQKIASTLFLSLSNINTVIPQKVTLTMQQYKIFERVW